MVKLDILETSANMLKELSKEIDRRVVTAKCFFDIIDINESLTKPVIFEIEEILKGIDFYG